MSGYLSNLLTTTTSRYNTLRQQLLPNEADGDTEDDSHISRALRAYYTEKGRPFPPWLPPDPNAPQAAPAQFVSSSGRQQAPPMGRGGGGGLSDLWDSPQPQQQQQEPLSLRRAQGRGGGGRGRPGMGQSLTPEPAAQGRPLPSQRAGSYQSSFASGRPPAEASPPPSAGSGTSAQDRLKARLWGSGRSNSPAQSTTSSTSTSPASTRNPYERPGAQGGGGGGRPPYPDDRSSGYSGGGGGGGRQQQSSYNSMSANSPWVGNDDPYGPSGGYGGGGGGGAPQDRRRVGLPSGPRMRS